MAWSAALGGSWLHDGLVPLAVLGIVGHLYTCALLIGVVALRSRLLSSQAFTARKYYLLMGWAPLTFLALAMWIDVRFLVFAPLAALAGIIGETLLGLMWSRFFAKPIWTYSYRALLHGRTATINLLPWMVGALLFLITARFVGVDPAEPSWSLSSPLLVSVAALGAGALLSVVLLLLLWPNDQRAKRFTLPRFALFCLPIAVTAVALAALCDPRYAVLMASFAIVGAVTEYAYGRSMSLFFRQQLWTYHHLPVDGGHSSLVTVPLWALGGLYFFWIAAQVGLA